ncbi:MAG TPA: hypothetical protein VKP65_03055 [Rhodothermales bacterium]|nr:hypothetical protein [Rhodothermales bacterium]
MPADSLLPERPELPPFIKPYLQTLDRMQQREALQPEQHTAWARRLLETRYGLANRAAEAAFAHGALGLLAGHSHYADGYAVLMPLEQGTAVAVQIREDDQVQISFEGDETRWVMDVAEKENQPVWVRVAMQVVQHLAPGQGLDVAVVSTMPPGCMDAYLAALTMATTRALQALLALPDSTRDLLPALCHIIASSTTLPFSKAFLMASEAETAQQFVLADTSTDEHMPLEAPSPKVLGWGLVDVGTGQRSDVALHQKRRDRAEQTLVALREKGFPDLVSLQQLEHRDLERALQVLPRRLKPVLRHLVTENRRVQKLVVAARRRDWQLFGAMLLMSHASLRDDWGQTNEEVDLVVEQVEAMSLEGMYGACATGRGGCVLVLGKPFVVPACLDRIEATFERRFGRKPGMMVV